MLGAIRRNVTWRAIPLAALAAGTAHLAVTLLLTPLLLQVQPTVVLRYMGSLIMGPDVVNSDAIAPIIVGVIEHYIISLVLALIIAIVVHRWGLLVGIVGGALLGLAFYSINIYFMTRFFEWFFAMNSPVLLLAHVVFGAVAGGVYEMFDHFDLPADQPA